MCRLLFGRRMVWVGSIAGYLVSTEDVGQSLHMATCYFNGVESTSESGSLPF